MGIPAFLIFGAHCFITAATDDEAIRPSTMRLLNLSQFEVLTNAASLFSRAPAGPHRSA